MGTLQSELVEKGLSDARTGEVERKSTKGKPSEQLTDRDLRYLMGEYRQTHKRVNGAIRRR